MIEVAPKLYVGTSVEARRIFSQQDEWRLVNVAKTIHLEIHRWSKRDSNSPYYVIHEEQQRISVSWMKAPRTELFNYQNGGGSVVLQALVFIRRSLQERKKVLRARY